MPDAEVETPAVEVSVEVPAVQADAATPAEVAQVAGDAAAAQPSDDRDEVIADLRAQVETLTAQAVTLTQELSAATSARDAAMGQANEAQARIKPLQDEMATMRTRLADYEVGAALANHGLPAQASALVRTLYASSGMYHCIQDWLGQYLQSPEGAALVMLKSAVQADPRVAAPAVGGSNPTMPSLNFGYR